MSAAEIIEQIRKLPAAEQEQVRAFLESQRKAEAPASYVGDAEFDKSADKILREHAELFRRLAQ
jgi:hypothetical protein